MKEITLPRGKYLMLKVWADAKNFQIINGFAGKYLSGYLTIERLPFGNWQIIGKADEMGEDEWKGIVEYKEGLPFTNFEKKVGTPKYNDYCRPLFLSPNFKDPVDFERPFSTATESGHSLLSSHGMKPETTLMLRLIPSGLAIDSTKVK